MTVINSFWIRMKSTGSINACPMYAEFVSGDGVEFVESVDTCVDDCSNPQNKPVITINAVPVGSTWTLFEFQMSAAWASDANGVGLNLTAIAPTRTKTSDGSAATQWTVNDVEFQISINGKLLSLAEYTLSGGIFTLLAPTIISEGDNLQIWRIGS